MGTRKVITAAHERWRSPFATSEDRNVVGTHGCGHLRFRWRSPFATSEDRNKVGAVGASVDLVGRVALAVRDERGSQRIARCVHRARGRWGGGARRSRRARIATMLDSLQLGVPGEWRSPFATSEDRNLRDVPWTRRRSRAWRSPFATSEDRNTGRSSTGQSAPRRGARRSRRARIATRLTCGARLPVRWRSPFTASEDRNSTFGPTSGALRNWWRSPFTASEDRNCERRLLRVRSAGGARRSRRARIATPLPAGRWIAASEWRSPFTASEDRNAVTAGLAPV